MCRICHEGSSQEDLLSPCECTGTLGTIHRSCLEHWLSSSNTSYCELCHFRFAVERKPRPLVETTTPVNSQCPSSNTLLVLRSSTAPKTLHFRFSPLQPARFEEWQVAGALCALTSEEQTYTSGQLEERGWGRLPEVEERVCRRQAQVRGA
ncbi:hypothetical protein MC885_017231 [Smutsia gigantea]|nr:hypothetical protein MC885_017231 [Smutsia gigantea]